MKKYEITDIAHPDNPNLHRIRAVTDLTEDVLAGMLGGYVESCDNLDQDGRAWISADAIACENAVVCGDAVLTDHAVAKGCAYVGKNAAVTGDATVQDDAMGRKYPVLRPPGKERFVRFKTLGKRYTPEAIQTRILYPQSYHPYVENPPTIKHGRLHRGKKPHRKLTGLRALYYRYLYELGALPRKPRRPSYAVRQDAYKLDQRIRQMEFLSKHNIDTLEQLETHRKALQTEIGQLQTKRKQLPKTDDVQSQHESVNTALKQLRQEERLCRKIAEHSIEVQQHLTEARRDRAEQQKQEQERARDRRPNIDLTL